MCFLCSHHIGGQVVGEYLLGSESTSHLGLLGALVEIVVIVYPSLPPPFPLQPNVLSFSKYDMLTQISLVPTLLRQRWTCGQFKAGHAQCQHSVRPGNEATPKLFIP